MLRVILCSVLLTWSLVTASTTDSSNTDTNPTVTTIQNASTSWATTTDQISTFMVNNTNATDYVGTTTWPTSPSSNSTAQTNSSWATTTDQISTLAGVNSTTMSVGTTTWPTPPTSNSTIQTTNSSWATTTDQISTLAGVNSTTMSVASTTISSFALSNGSTSDSMSSTTTSDQISTSVASLTSPSTTIFNQTTQTMSSTITTNPTTQTMPSTMTSDMTTQTMSATTTSDMTTHTMPSTTTSDMTTHTMPSTTTSDMTTQTTTTSDMTTQTMPSTTTSDMTTQTMSSTTTADQISTNVSSSSSPSTTIFNQTTGAMSSTTTQTSPDVQTTSTDEITTQTFIGVPNATFSPQVIAARNLSADNSKYEPIFLCTFEDATGNSLLYNVKWHINSNELQNARFQTYSFATINHTALRPEHWTGTYSLNMDVKCSVSAQYTTNSNPGSWYESPNFRAGFTIDTSFLSLNEEESKTITVTSTVPVGCSASYTDAEKEANCKGNLHIRTLDWGWCWNGVKYLAAVFPDNGCLLQFPYSNWDQPVYLNITGYVDGMRNWWYRYTRVKFESASDTNTATSNAWNNIDISDTVSVYTYDPNSYSGGLAMCGSFNDPHMVTFDRKWYENQRTGEFILYRHKSGKYQVNALYSTCYPWRATCNCGVGIRSGQNLYVVRTCLEVSLQRVNLLDIPYEAYNGCSNDDEIVVEKTGSNYRVTLSSGTEISFSLSYWSNWISFIQVVPSATDKENTEGLCGLYNDDRSDDFIPKGDSSPTDDRTFALSWRVDIGSAESLFVENPNLSGNTGTGSGSSGTPAIKYCTCSSYSNVQSNPNYATCNLQAPTEPCSSVTGQTVNTCSSSSRRRRSTVDSDDIIDKPSFSYDPDYNASFEIVNPEFFNGWNESYANEFCNKSFTEDPAVTTCIEKVNTSATEYIKGCVDDIKMLGNASFLSATIDTLKKACVTTASRDQSFQNNTDGGGGVSILDLLKSLTCLNNCSQQGTCANETCTCDDGFIGEDCSETLSTPPTSISLPGPMCESNVRACAKTNIAGKFHSENITANCTHFTSTSEGKVYSGYFVYVNATYRHQNLISVQLPTPPNSRRRKRSTANSVNGWDIQLSYDGVNYGTAVTILVFNSDLSSCDPTTLKCVSRVTGDSNTSDSDNTAAIAAGVAVAAVVVITLIVVVVFVKVNKRGKQRARVSTSDHDMRGLQD